MTTIYLGGPINGATDEEASGWREAFKAELGPEFTYRDPMDRDYRGREDECVAEIVELDKDDIDESDIVVGYCWQVSVGTSMEIFYAWDQRFSRIAGPFVLLVIPEGTRISPWLRYHSDAIVGTLAEAQALIRAIEDEAPYPTIGSELHIPEHVGR